jgi:hypothetical protein
MTSAQQRDPWQGPFGMGTFVIACELKILRLESSKSVIACDGGVNAGKLGTWDLMKALD